MIAEVPLFATLNDDERAALAARLTTVCYKTGDTIFNFGDPGDALYIVKSGRVELFIKDKTGERITFFFAEHGDVFGEISCFDHGPRSTTAYVTEDAELFALGREPFTEFLRSKPDAAVGLLGVLGRRLRETNRLLLGRVSRNTNVAIEQNLSTVQKIANFIAEYSGSMEFLGLNLAVFVVWITLNLELLPLIPAFDPYPFGLLTMAVSLEAIFLSIFVLLSQNLQAAKDRVRSDIEYEINLKAELEVAELHEKVDLLQAEILRRLQSLSERTNQSSPSA